MADEYEVLAKRLLRGPSAQPPQNKSHWPKKGQLKPNIEHQADLLFMPHDHVDGHLFKYILVVVDVGTRRIDARALKNKIAEHVVEAFMDIYNKSPYLNVPKQIDFDAGSEFKGAVKSYFQDLGTRVRIALPNRHTQQALVEGTNRSIAYHLFLQMLADELRTGVKSTTWVSRLPRFIQLINQNRAKMESVPPINPNTPPTTKGELIPEGTNVRVGLDFAIDAVSKKKTDSKFRTGDIRWSDITTIDRIIILPGRPVRYMVKGKPNVSYSRNQVLIV